MTIEILVSGQPLTRVRKRQPKTMPTHRSSWKRRERDDDAKFGARRKVLSGSSGRDDRTCSDSTHERLFTETKLRASSAVRSLWEKTRDLARKEGKTPVVILYDKHKQGGLIVVHEGDLLAVARELGSLIDAEA